ncbi:MAG: hypothetical protein ACOY3I_00265 [Verrucomicrobiota bacterium]
MNKFQFWSVLMCLLVIVAFFLPWMRPLPEEIAKDSKQMKEQLATDKSNFWLDYIGMRDRDRQDLLLDSTEGVSGYQILMEKNEKSRVGRLTQTTSQYLFGAEQADWRIRMGILAPLFGLLSLWFVLWEGMLSRWLLLLGLAQTFFYGFARWLMTEGNLLHLELCWAPGIWLTLYGTLLLAAGNFFLCTQKR